MFSSKKLIDTPGRGNGITRKGHEFTPIGSKSRLARESNYKGRDELNTEKYMNRPLFVPINEDPNTIHQSMLDSSFDNTVDNFDNTFNSFHKPAKSSNVSRPLNEHNLISNGVPSIKEQELRSRKLETENYNLKIKLATLQRFFEQTPEEQKKLLSENVGLRQQLVELTEEIERLKDLNQNLQYSSNKENLGNVEDYEMKITNVKSEYKQIISEKDDQILQYEKRIKQLEKQLEQPNIPTDTLDTLDELRSDNQTLRRKIEVLNNDISNFEYKDQSLKKTIDALKQDVSKYKHDSISSENNYKNQLNETKLKLNELKNESTYWKEKFESFSARNNDDKHEINELNSKLSDYQYRYEDLKAKFQQTEIDLNKYMNDNQRLNKRIESLEEDIHEKSQEEYNLRSQISAFINEKQSNDRSKYYESEIELLKQKGLKLTEHNKELKKELDELQEQLYQNNNNSSTKLRKLQDEINEYKDRISYYEKEYESLQTAFINAESEITSLKKKISENNKLIINLEGENRLLSKKNDNKPNSSAILELENFNRRKLENEKSLLENENKQLMTEIDSINFEMKKLKQGLEIERNKRKKEPYLETEYQKLLIENRELQNKIDEMKYSKMFNENNIEFKSNNYLETEYQKLLIENNQLQNKLKEIEVKHLNEISNKQIFIKNLESKIFELNSNYNNDEEKSKLIKQKSNQELKIRKLEFDLENLTKDYQSEIDYYKNKIMVLENQRSNKDNNESSVILLLEKQLEDSQRLRNDLSERLSKSISATDELAKKLSESTSNNDELIKKFNKLQENNNELNRLVSKLENNEQFLKLDNNKLEIKNKNLNEEIKNLNKYNNKLIAKIKQLKQKEFNDNDLNYKISEINLNSKHDQEIKILNNELKYYKAKLYDINLKANDFEVVYSFIINSIKNSNRLIKNDLMKLVELGIYPDYSLINKGNNIKDKKTIPFKVLAKFVLSAIRIKKRYERSTFRKSKLFELKNEIESDKITLIS